MATRENTSDFGPAPELNDSSQFARLRLAKPEPDCFSDLAPELLLQIFDYAGVKTAACARGLSNFFRTFFDTHQHRLGGSVVEREQKRLAAEAAALTAGELPFLHALVRFDGCTNTYCEWVADIFPRSPTKLDTFCRRWCVSRHGVHQPRSSHARIALAGARACFIIQEVLDEHDSNRTRSFSDLIRQFYPSWRMGMFEEDIAKVSDPSLDVIKYIHDARPFGRGKNEFPVVPRSGRFMGLFRFFAGHPEVPRDAGSAARGDGSHVLPAAQVSHAHPSDRVVSSQ